MGGWAVQCTLSRRCDCGLPQSHVRSIAYEGGWCSARDQAGGATRTKGPPKVAGHARKTLRTWPECSLSAILVDDRATRRWPSTSPNPNYRSQQAKAAANQSLRPS